VSPEDSEGVLRWFHNRILCGRGSQNSCFGPAGLAAVLCVLLLQTGCQVTVGGRQRPLVSHEQIQGALELDAERQIDKRKINGDSNKFTRTDFKEILRLSTSGDIYHRNLLLYTAAVGVGLRQQRFTSGGRTDTAEGSLDEYDLTADILQAKPYPITLYTSRSDDTQGRSFSGSVRTKNERLGGLMGFRVIEDWPMKFQYSKDDTEQDSLGSVFPDSYTRTDERFRYSVSHDFSASSTGRFAFERQDIFNRRLTSSSDLKVDRYDLSHDLLFGGESQHRLDSDFYLFDYSGISDETRLRWQELMRLKHASNLWTNYTFQFTESRQQGAGNKETLGQVGFRHELYRSLVTTGDVFASKSEVSRQVDLTERGGRLGFDYRKKNPWGVLFSSYSTSVTRFDQTGGGDIGTVNDEPHTFVVAGLPQIQLNRRNVDAASVIVADSIGIPYDLTLDYRIEENSGITSIVVIVGGKIYDDAVANGGTIDLLISYNFFVEPEQKTDIHTQSFSIRQRFASGPAFYYRHRRRDEQIRSSVTEITPDEFRVNTYGAEYSGRGLYLRGEYEKHQSTQIPTTTKRLEANYIWTVSYGTRASVRVSHLWNDFGGDNPHDVEVLTAGGALSSRFTERHTLIGSADYRRERDSSFGDTTGFQFDIGLRYDYRQLSFSTGVEFDMLGQDRDDRDTTFYYFRLRRQF